jgi:hypothetical protein
VRGSVGRFISAKPWRPTTLTIPSPASTSGGVPGLSRRSSGRIGPSK